MEVNMDYEYRKLRGRIREMFFTERAFADCLGISRTSLSKKLNGKTEFSQADIREWCQLLNIKESEISEYFFA